QIHAVLRGRGDNIGLGTVYRTLGLSDSRTLGALRPGGRPDARGRRDGLSAMLPATPPSPPVPVVWTLHRDRRPGSRSMGRRCCQTGRVHRHQPYHGGVRPLSGLLARGSGHRLTPAVADDEDGHAKEDMTVLRVLEISAQSNRSVWAGDPVAP